MFELSPYGLVCWIFGETTAERWYQRMSKNARIYLGKSNVHQLARNASKVRPKTRIALDTQLHQLANYERAGWFSQGTVNWGDHEINAGFLGPYAPDFGKLAAEVAPLYSIFELARQDAIQFVKLPTVEDERKKRPTKHIPSLGCTPLDHDVDYQELQFGCSRMNFSHRTTWGPVENRDPDECRFELRHHSLIYRHLAGKKQQKDAWHLMLCDAFGLDFYLTADRPFLNAYNQISEKLKKDGMHTIAISPEELCKELTIRPINPPIPDPKAIFRGLIR